MINWERVAELRDEIGEEDFAEVVEMFLEEVEEVIQRLKSDPRPELFEMDLHYLKSSALNLGFAEFSRLCHEGEILAASGKSEAVRLEPVFGSFARSRAAFEAGQMTNSATVSSRVMSV